MSEFNRTIHKFSNKSLEEITQEISKWKSTDYNITSIDELKKLANKISQFAPFQTFKFFNDSKVYRGRIGAYNNKSDLWYPPAKLITKLGRVNRINQQIFYCSNSGGISLYELYPQVGDLITIIECESKSLSVHNIGVMDNLKLKSDESFFQSKNGQKINLIYNFLKEEFTKKVQDGDENLYKLSISIFEHLTDTEMVDGLLYPSIAANMTGFNLALKSEIADSHLKISKAYIVRVDELKEKELIFTLVDSTQNISKDGDFIYNTSADDFEWAYTKTIDDKSIRLLKKGINLNKTKNYSEAIVNFKEVLEYNSHHLGALINRGISYYLLGKYKQAIDDFDKVLDIQPFSIKALNNRAAAFFSINEYSKSIEDYETIINLDTNYLDAYCGLGMNNGALNKNDLAIKNYNLALKIDSNDCNTHYSLANTYRKINKFELAFSHYNIAISLNSNSSRSYNNRGITYALSNNLQLAINDFKKAILIDSKNQDAINNLKRAESQITRG